MAEKKETLKKIAEPKAPKIKKTAEKPVEKTAHKKEVPAKQEKKIIKSEASTAPEAILLYEKYGIKYYRVTATCACGGSYETGSTLPVVRVDICANCHPFFTGEHRILDAEGRVDKFKKKYKLA